MTRDALRTTGILPGVTIDEIIELAVANIGIDWTIDGCTDFVWGVTNLAGAPFFDLRDLTTAGDPAAPLDVNYVVPHSPGILSGTDNVASDGWSSVYSGKSASEISAILQPGDVVRFYADGNTTEVSASGNGYFAHSFIVVSVARGNTQVLDNWNTAGVVQHELNDIAATFVPVVRFKSAFGSHIDEEHIAEKFADDFAVNR